MIHMFAASGIPAESASERLGITIELVKSHQTSCRLDNQMYEVAKTLQALLADVRDDLEAKLLGT